MSTTAAAESTLTLTSEQIRHWLAGTDTSCVLTQAWSAGRPASFSVPALSHAVPICRRLARRWLDRQHIDDEDTRDCVALVVSELISNAILHSSSLQITCRLSTRRDHVRIEVRDQSRAPSAPRLVHPPQTALHGRGLAILTEVTSAWGMRHTAGQCTVWATVPATFPATARM